MILSQIATGKQMILGGVSCRESSRVIVLPKEVTDNGFCLCDYSVAPCLYFELANTDIDNPLDDYLNDYRKFLLNPLSASSTFSFILIEKDGTEHVIYSKTESTTDFGEVYERGFNAAQPLQVGVNILWYKVVDTIGYGDYTIKLTQTDFGNVVSDTTHVFRVVKFDAVRSNGTIKIEVDNVGVTMNGKNWTGLTTGSEDMFTNMIRVNGNFILTDPDIEIESIEDGTRTERPVQTKITDNFSIDINRVPFGIGLSLIHEDVVMNWRVTDYNVLGDDLRNQELIIQSTAVENITDYTRKSYVVTAKRNVSKLNRKFV